MALLIGLLLAWGVLRALGWLGIGWLASWRNAARLALSILFIFTASSHFTTVKGDLLAMIPPPLPQSLWLIYLTGVLELAGAIGLLIPRLQRYAALGLILLLIAMFPANVYAALNDIELLGSSPTPLWLRLPMQLILIGMLWWSSLTAQSQPSAVRIRPDHGDR